MATRGGQKRPAPSAVAPSAARRRLGLATGQNAGRATFNPALPTPPPPQRAPPPPQRHALPPQPPQPRYATPTPPPAPRDPRQADNRQQNKAPQVFLRRGEVASYTEGKKFGFIRCAQIADDVYFQKRQLPAGVETVHPGQVVDFEFHMTEDGKPRADRILAVVDNVPIDNAPRHQQNASRPQHGGGKERSDKPLSAQLIEDMRQFLEDQGGAMYYGKFARQFKGFKKSQLEVHFTVVPEADGGNSGTCQIMLPGVEPLLPEELDSADQRPRDPPPPPAPAGNKKDFEFVGHFEGKIARMNEDFGFIHSDGFEGDAYFKRNQLPEEARSIPKTELPGRLVSFEMLLTPDRKPRAEHISFIVEEQEEMQVDNNNYSHGNDSSHGNKKNLEFIGQFEGKIARMNKDFGFITSEGFEGDAYFKRKQLPEEARGIPESELCGRLVSFEMLLTPDRKPRAERISFIAEEQEEPLLDGNDSSHGTKKELEFIGQFEGRIARMDKGYGFIKSDGFEGDAYFKRDHLPEEAKGIARSKLVGKVVSFDMLLTPDKKPRAEQILFIGGEQEEATLNGNVEEEVVEPEGRDDIPDDPVESEAEEKPKKDAPVLPELDPELVDQMNAFLDDRGGFMDYGKFAAEFKGKKKTQLEPHFTFIQEGGGASGRWTIAQIGVEVPERIPPNPPKPPKEHRHQEQRQQEHQQHQQNDHRQHHQRRSIAPSHNIWLIGYVKKWLERGDCGFLIADGADDVFVHQRDLPPEAYDKHDMLGVEMAFELGQNDDGKLKALQVRPLLTATPDGGWELRRRR